MKNEILDYPISEADKKAIEEIKSLEVQYSENERNLNLLRADIDYKKSKLNISYQPLIIKCLELGKDFFALKTPIQVADCVTANFGIEASREMKNNIATNLSMLFRDEKIGRIEINGKNYYGLTQYFNNDLETLKPKYVSLIEGRKKNP